MNQNLYIQNGVLAIFSKIKTRVWFLASMRVHSLVALFLIGIVPTIIFSSVLIDTYRERAREDRTREMQSQGTALSNILVSSGYIVSPSVPEVDTELTRVASIYEGRIIVVDNHLTILKDTYGIEDGNILIYEDVVTCLRGNGSSIVRNYKEHIEMTAPVIHNTTKEIMGVVIMKFSVKNTLMIADTLEQAANTLFIIIVIIISALAFLYSRAFTKPLIKLKNAIGHIAEGYMEEEVQVHGFYEIKQISNSLNLMLNRVKNLERSRQEFVSNVSHELKTPLTSVKVLADSLLMQENAEPELYREFLVDIAEEIERENKIINDLLSLVKLDKTASDMNITSVKINELLEQVLKRLRPIAKKSNIELVFESFRPVVAEIDEVKLSLALSNLIENAIKYNVEDGWVRVSLNADHKYFYVKVSDSGIGIPEDAQDFIFDRFYRVDKARSRGTGGTGLGLAITKSVIHMHKGAVKIYSKENEGATFTVRIPINYIA